MSSDLPKGELQVRERKRGWARVGVERLREYIG